MMNTFPSKAIGLVVRKVRYLVGNMYQLYQNIVREKERTGKQWLMVHLCLGRCDACFFHNQESYE